MPLSLRLPVETERSIAAMSAQLGLSKSAIIVRGVEAYLREHAAPTAHELFLMTKPKGVASQPSGGASQALPIETRPHKLAMREVMREKQAARAARSASHQDNLSDDADAQIRSR